MNEFLTNINNLVANNQILSTVAGGSVIVWLVTNIKGIFFGLVNAVKSLISFNIVNIYEDNRASGRMVSAVQHGFNEFIEDTKVLWERTKSLDLSNGYSIDDPSTSDSNLKHSQIYGFSIRIIFGKLVLCFRQVNKGQKVTIETHLTVFFASKKKFMKRLDEEIARTVTKIREREYADNRKYTKVTLSSMMYVEAKKYKRSMDSIFTNDDQHRKLLESIKSFMDNEELYRKMSYPYSFSALLYGEPGCGKTSTILAIASELNLDIMYINPTKVSVTTLMTAMATPRTLIVFEDIDAVNSGVASNRENNEDEQPEQPNLLIMKEGLSLSEILNVTDGLLATDSSVCLFTTNHIESLDPALLRKGRMNEILEFGLLNAETANRMIEHHLGYRVDGLRDGIKPPELQDMIMDIKLGKAKKDDLVDKFTS